MPRRPTPRRAALALAALLLVSGGCSRSDRGAGPGPSPGAAPATAAFQLDAIPVVDSGGQDPTLAVLGDGAVLVAWGEAGTSGEAPDERAHVRRHTGGGVFVARSDDGGTTFAPPLRIDVTDPAAGEGFSTSTRNDRPPRLVVAAGGAVHVVWVATALREGERFPASDLRLATSTDGGRTFSPPRPVVDVDLSPGFYHAHGAGDGKLHVGFLTRSEEPDAIGSAVRVATSADGGETFVTTGEFTAGAVCQCCPVSFAEDSTGRLAMGWRHIYPVGDDTIRDHVVAFSDDGATNWSEWAKVHDDGWLQPQCPHSGSALGYDSRDRLHVAWYTGKDDAPGVYYTRAGARTAGFGAPVPLLTDEFFPIVEPDLAVDGDDTVWVAFGDERRDVPAVWLARIAPDGTATISDGPVTAGRYPRLATDGTSVLMTYELDGSVMVAAVRSG